MVAIIGLSLMNEKGIFIQSYAYLYYFSVYFNGIGIHIIKEEYLLCENRGNLTKDYIMRILTSTQYPNRSA